MTISHFHYASGLITLQLAHMLDSLVRVSRRVVILNILDECIFSRTRHSSDMLTLMAVYCPKIHKSKAAKQV